MVATHLAHINHLNETIDLVSAEISARLSHQYDDPPPAGEYASGDELPLDHDQQAANSSSDAQSPCMKALERLQATPGVGRRVAEVLLSEIGLDMSRFPTSAHLAAWAGMAPGNNESAGKRLGRDYEEGDPLLRSALVEAAHGVSHSKDNYPSAQFQRLVTRRGKKKAAVGHSILVIAYHLLKKGTVHSDLGANCFDERAKDAAQRRLVNRLERLGYRVDLQPAATIA